LSVKGIFDTKCGCDSGDHEWSGNSFNQKDLRLKGWIAVQITRCSSLEEEGVLEEKLSVSIQWLAVDGVWVWEFF
jgi:hypothetical protein